MRLDIKNEDIIFLNVLSYEEMASMLDKVNSHFFLFQELVSRDFKKKYKNTFLGMIWSLLSPLLMLLVMKIVFTNFFGASIPHYTIYLLSGNIVFSYFNESTSQGMLSFLENAGIISNVNVPSSLFILSRNMQTLINFMLSIAVFFIFCLIDRIIFSWIFLLLLCPIVFLFLFNVGISLILSSLYVRFRDMQYLWGIFSQILMYASAIFFSIDGYPMNVQNRFLLNPVYVFITYFRKVVINGEIPSPGFHLLMIGHSMLAVAIGIMVYRKNKKTFLYYM